MYVGTSYVEADGEDFFNTFVLAAPDGTEAGRVRKQSPTMGECHYFRGEAGSHVIDTALGRIGVGVCNDNHMAYLPQLMQQQSVDLMLQPHAWGAPLRPVKAVTQADIDELPQKVPAIAALYANALGVPAVMVNRCGPYVSPAAPSLLLKHLLPGPEDYGFPGFSAIADSDGTFVARAGQGEELLVTDVVLAPARKKPTRPATYGRWCTPGTAGRYLVVVDEVYGKVGYALSGERRRRARAISARG